VVSAIIRRTKSALSFDRLISSSGPFRDCAPATTAEEQLTEVIDAFSLICSLKNLAVAAQLQIRHEQQVLHPTQPTLPRQVFCAYAGPL
jgi:hypothetical protein